MKTEHIKILIFAIAISFVMVVAFYIYFGEAKVENEKGDALQHLHKLLSRLMRML